MQVFVSDEDGETGSLTTHQDADLLVRHSHAKHNGNARPMRTNTVENAMSG